MGAATMAYTLWSRYLKGSATDPKWADRDRFILSAGHGSVLLYSLLHLFGYEVTMDDLKSFRQWGSKTPGHPEYGHTAGVETTTGPLGQGVANAVGMAIAERKMASEFNTSDFTVVNHYTYALAGDGCIMEGITHEAASLAGHLRLGKLIMLYDSNKITIDGSTDKSMTEDVGKRYEAYGWQVLYVQDGNDVKSIEDAIGMARVDTTKPTLIIVSTTIGYGSPNQAGKSSVHGSPLGDAEIKLMKEMHGWHDCDPFYISEDVNEFMKELIDKREIERFIWEEEFEKYAEKFPEKAKKWEQWHEYEEVDAFEPDSELWEMIDKDDATRSIGATVMNHLSQYVPNLAGGSADLVGSTKTYLKGFGDFSWENTKGSNIFFGVREHAMAAILNGMALHGGLRVFGSTFLTFADYMKPSMRLAALMKLPVIYVFTHDSIAVGEDGPTHQPIEHLLMLRSIPNMAVYRPADAKETAFAWREALKRTAGPAAIILTRQKLKRLPHVSESVDLGAYVVVKESGTEPDVLLIGTGSEVGILVEAQKELLKSNIEARVVSMICKEVFEEQTESYQELIIPSAVTKRITMEAGRTIGWEKYAGVEGICLGVDDFGASAPGDVIYEKYGLTVERVVDTARELYQKK